MRSHRTARLLPGIAMLVLAACGPGSTQPAPAATPLPAAEVRRLYLTAAAAYIQDEPQIEKAEYDHCTPETGSPNLAACEQALSQDRQTTLAFDNAVRQIAFPDSARTDVSRLLTDDAQLETLLEQAATAPSLSAIQAMSSQIFSLLSATSADGDRVRADIGLPAATTPPSTPQP